MTEARISTWNSRGRSITITQEQADLRTLIAQRLGYVFGRCTLDNCKDKEFVCCERPSSSGETWYGSNSPIHIVHKSESKDDDFLMWPDDALIEAERVEREQ